MSVSQDWTEKYRPKSLSGVIGNPKAVGDLTRWAEAWNAGKPTKRAAVLMGSPGIGKTTSAEALAADMGWDLVEMNASDQRTGDAIRNIALRGSKYQTFGDDGSFLSTSEGRMKLIVLDEADSLFGNADRGAMPVINELIKTSQQPVILIVNDFYELSRKSTAIKSDTLQITFHKPTVPAIIKALRGIAAAEGIEVSDDAVRAVAENSNGDMRAAVRDFESIGLGRKELGFGDTAALSNRIIRKSIYDLMYGVFRKGNPMAARQLMKEVDEEPSYVLLWVDENLPYEYRSTGDLVRAYEKVSRADIYLGRVRRRQYYGFWSYAGDMMTAGVADARRGSYINRERFRFPAYMSKLSRSRGMRASKAAVCQKLADYTHNSTKRVSSEILPQLKIILKNDSELRAHLLRYAELEPEELAFIMGVKADSKAVKDAVRDAELVAPPVPETFPEQPSVPRRSFFETVPETEHASVPAAPEAPAADPAPEPAPMEHVTETKRPEPPAEESKPHLKKGQKSLFDF